MAELKKLNQHFLAGRLSDTQLALGVGRIQNMAREGLESIPLHTSLLLKLARVCDAGSKIHHSL
ncbi:hypothetical protein, partial [Burkholderia ubonensis]|uniref:hypothetical protein n=1 Tax=Burkholderia ubonensis TaxID=101571 RepID=UPI001E285530